MNYPPYNPYQMGQFAPQMRPVPQMGNFPMQAQNVPQAAPQPQQPGFSLRQVTSKLEAESAQIPFDGSTSWFYDTSADRLYSKTFDFNTGTAPLVAYVREQAAPVIQYATVEDIQQLRQEIDALKPRKAAKKNDAEE